MKIVFFPIDESSRSIAKRLFQEVEKLPIISPHGHTDPYWFAQNENFTNATDLLVIPDPLYFENVNFTRLKSKEFRCCSK